jgi:hypothetical protein
MAVAWRTHVWLVALMLGGSSTTSESPGVEAEGEEEEAIETDRDSFTPATRLVGKGLFIFESAYSFLDNRGVKETHSLPEALLRYGLLERLELRLGWNYEVGGAGNDVSGSGFAEDELGGPGLERESTLSYGIKAAVTRQEEWVPRSAIILTGLTPTSGRETAAQFVGTYVLGWELPNCWQLDTAIRYGTATEEQDHFSVWAPSAVIRVPVGESWNVHAEWFSIFSSGRTHESTRHFFSPGVHYLVTENIEVGVRVGWGLNDQSARFFSNVGFGWRF